MHITTRHVDAAGERMQNGYRAVGLGGIGVKNRERRQHRRREDDAERVAGLFLAGRDAGELAGEKFEIAFDQSEIGSGLVDLPQCELGADMSSQSAPTQHRREPQKQPQLEALPPGQQQM